MPVDSDASSLRLQQLIGHPLIALQAGQWAAVTLLGLATQLVQVVKASGDTDTDGAVGGAYGAASIPVRWLECVPKRDRSRSRALEQCRHSGLSPAIPESRWNSLASVGPQDP